MTTAATCFQTFADGDFDLQRPADVAVVMPTVIRPTLKEALQSVFRQQPARRIQVLIGIDRPSGDIGPDVGAIAAICAERPAHACVNVFYPGYSTSQRHGGLHPAYDGGVLRCVLTYLANARYVAYLDDDNWWTDDHLASMLAAIKDHQWAFSLRWFVHPDTRRAICVDQWESVGPGRGVFAQKFGGWVDPNCLMIDKLECHQAIPWWTRPFPTDPTHGSADRQVFGFLNQHFRSRGSNAATVYYQLNAADLNHADRVKAIGAAYDAAGMPETVAVR
jgi:hypothetical protein